MSRVLVTGGAGYIGAHVAAELLKSGYSIRIYDDFSNGLHRRVDGKFRDIVDGDMLDRVKLLAALDGIDAVIHLAAKKAVEESVKDPLKYLRSSLEGIHRLALHGENRSVMQEALQLFCHLFHRQHILESSPSQLIHQAWLRRNL